jgi:hypothetical protein
VRGANANEVLTGYTAVRLRARAVPWQASGRPSRTYCIALHIALHCILHLHIALYCIGEGRDSFLFRRHIRGMGVGGGGYLKAPSFCTFIPLFLALRVVPWYSNAC